MAPVTFHLVSVADEEAFLRAVRNHDISYRLLYFGRCEHWIHSPKTSLEALTGPGPEMRKWDFVLVHKTSTADTLALPEQLASFVTAHWAISAFTEDAMLDSLPAANKQRALADVPVLPVGWTATDHSAHDASTQPPDLEFSLSLESVPLGSPKDGATIVLKDYVRVFAQLHPGPVSMFNILACLPGQRSRLFQYFAAFTESIGARYGGQPSILATDVTDWSSREDEGAAAADPEAGGSGVWEDVGLVWYPTIWHFAKLLDDPDYADADRKYKQGVLKDGSILMVTEIKLD